MAQDWVQAGTVASVNPARREVRITPAPGMANQLNDREWLGLNLDGEIRACRVDVMRWQGDRGIAELSPGVPRDAVRALRKGSGVYIRREELAAPPEEFPAEAVTGFDVQDEDGTRLGVVTTVYSSTRQSAIEISRPGGGTLLLPFVEATVVGVDPARKLLTVRGVEQSGIEDPAPGTGDAD